VRVSTTTAAWAFRVCGRAGSNGTGAGALRVDFFFFRVEDFDVDFFEVPVWTDFLELFLAELVVADLPVLVFFVVVFVVEALAVFDDFEVAAPDSGAKEGRRTPRDRARDRVHSTRCFMARLSKRVQLPRWQEFCRNGVFQNSDVPVAIQG
jgi:hypothetical protein